MWTRTQDFGEPFFDFCGSPHTYPLFLVSPETIQIWLFAIWQFLAIEPQNGRIIKSVLSYTGLHLVLYGALLKRFVSQLQHTLHSVSFHLLFCTIPKYWGFIPVGLFQISYCCTWNKISALNHMMLPWLSVQLIQLIFCKQWYQVVNRKSDLRCHSIISV